MSLMARLFVIMTVLLLAVCTTLAADVLTYQGRLTDASNNPVADGVNALRFRIYDAPTGGNLLWQEYNPVVQTTDGMFSVRLGELTALDLGSLGNGTLYLEIVVGLSPAALSPRTPLTSSPRSAVAGKVMGDLETAPGVLTIKRSDGDSTLSIRSFDGGISMRMFDPQPEPPGKAVVDMSVDMLDGASLKLFDPQPEPPGKALEILSGNGLNQTSPAIRMFDPQPEPPGKLFELVARSGSSPSMSFFNQAGQVMGVEPTPWNTGFSIKMFDPQPEPPGKMLEFGTSYGTGAASVVEGAGDTAWFKTYGLDALGGQTEFVSLYSTDTDAELRLGQGAALTGTSSYISAKSNGLESKIELVGPMGASPAPPVVIRSMNGAARIGIGTSSPTQALHVVGNICYTGTIGGCSDGRYKKEIQPVDHALAMVSELEGVRYQWKTEEYPDQQFSEGKQIGFVAQEVKKVLPEVVMEQPDGSLAIDYGRLTPVLLEAIKELKKQNDQLFKRVEALEKK